MVGARGLHTFRSSYGNTATTSMGGLFASPYKISTTVLTPLARHLSVSVQAKDDSVQNLPGVHLQRQQRRGVTTKKKRLPSMTLGAAAAAVTTEVAPPRPPPPSSSYPSSSAPSSSTPRTPGVQREQELYNENDDDFTRERKKHQQQMHEQEVAERMFNAAENAGQGDTQIHALKDRETRQHVAKVYSTAGSGLALATASSAVTITTGLAWALPMGGLIPALVSMAPMMMLMNSSPQTHSPTYRKALFGTFVGLQGWAMAPLLGSMFALKPMVIPLALGGTASVLIVASAAALLVPRGSFLKYGTALGGGAVALMVASIANIWIGSSLMQTGIIGGLMLVFTGFIVYDTQSIIERFRAGDRDHLQGAVQMFLDIINMFKLMLIMFGFMSDD